MSIGTIIVITLALSASISLFPQYNPIPDIKVLLTKNIREPSSIDTNLTFSLHTKVLFWSWVRIKIIIKDKKNSYIK
jgi:hypothetical protein